jgi:uncharacterized protein YuzE
MSTRAHIDLEITYRDGRPRFGYLDLGDPSEKSERSRRVSPEMVIDINKNGKLIGIELLDPTRVTLEAINVILKEYNLEPISESDLAPIRVDCA